MCTCVGRARLASDLAQVISEPIFDIPWLVETPRDQRLNPLLGGRSSERSDTCIPSGTQFDVRRQAAVDEALGLGNGPFVKAGDPCRERLYKRIEIGIGQGTIYVAVGLGLVCSDVFRAQEHLEGAVSQPVGPAGNEVRSSSFAVKSE